MVSTGLGTSEVMGTTLGRGKLYQMLVEGEKGPILLSPLSPDELIVIVADSSEISVKFDFELRKNRDWVIAAL